MTTVTIDTRGYNDCTIGRLTCGNFRCLTLELPWMENERNVSCIPAGHYRAELYDSPKHGKVVLINGVTNRTYIEIHSGNYTRQIQGCILVGETLKYLDNDDILDVTNSKVTLAKLLDLLPDKFEVEIIR